MGENRIRNIGLFLLFVLFQGAEGFSQKEDANWYFGDSAGINFSSGNPVSVQGSAMFSYEACATISNDSGNLLCYTDGVTIWNKNHDIMPNGNGLYAGPYSPAVGNSSTNGTLLLPKPDNANENYVISVCLINPTNGLFYSKIDMSLSGGLGAVTIEKNVLALADTLTEKLTAIKHANGRDWWIIGHLFHSGGSSRFCKFLLNPNGISFTGFQDIGSTFDFYVAGSSYGEIVVSNSGEKIACVNPYGVIDLFDFDRCTGLISNYQDLGIPPYNVYKGYYGCSFSPSGNNLFVSTWKSIYRYNLDTTDLLNSRRKLWSIPDSFFSICQHQITPDNKIYISISTASLPNDTACTEIQNLCVINNPDSSLANLDFQPFSFSIAPARTIYSLPNMPNYRLGALTGSPCDTIVSVRQKSENNKTEIYPNPGKDFVNVRTDHSGKQELTLFDSNGREVLHSTLVKGDNRIETASLSPGIYYFLISGNDGEYTSRKWVKVE